MWVLLEEFQTKQQGKEVYFKQWTGIGPATTSDLSEAHCFESKQEALLSAAYRHALSFFEPVEIQLTIKSKQAA